MLELSVLAVRDCPNCPVLLERLGPVLADYPDARVTRHVVTDEAEAVRLGMRGSPTLLVNGSDPFAAPGSQASLSCRVYRDESGQSQGAPSVAALRRAVRQAAGAAAGPEMPGAAGPAPGRLAPVAGGLRAVQQRVLRSFGRGAAGRAGLGRLAPVSGGLRAVQQRVLRSFAENGGPPAMTELDQAAAPYGAGGRAVLAQMHAEDFLRLDPAGAISTAYPFSAVPTPHVVRIDGGPEVFSMCAIDALGIAAMTDRAVTICSAEPGTGVPVTVTVQAGGDRAVWDPGDAVVYEGEQHSSGSCAPPDAVVPSVAADACCGFINFFASRGSAAAWAAAHPEVTGRTLSQKEALAAGNRIFGSLLRARL
ncbi:MAG TPA: alkylmercury lyase family protein [Streptosporangiaceae bacterium]|nr:alkylmercury lyase family protein [Streptosporangiaceae bacterium]